MNLRNKKQLAAKTLKVGKERIIFVKSRTDEIKEAITKQDIRDLKKEGAIIVKEIRGKKKKLRKKKKRNPGKIRKLIRSRKREYVILTRKLRKYLADEIKKGLTKNEISDIRKKVNNKRFRNKAHLMEYINSLKK
jgi:large subunit ribosomal protein L19e